jgi:hypothetical protein
MEQWAAGLFQANEEWQRTAIANAAALAEVNLYKSLRDLDYQQLTSVLEEDPDGKGNESVGPGALGPRPSV